MQTSPHDLEFARSHMVETQLRQRGISDVRVLRAMGQVPRECFVPPHLRFEAYRDGPLPIGEGQTISQPYMVAITCQSAGLLGHEKVLEIGAGSGYQAAVLGALAREVVTVERLPHLCELARTNLETAGTSNVKIVAGDGTLGHPAGAPYDAIVVAAAAPDIPPALVEQLAMGGRLVIPVGSRYVQRLTTYEKRASGPVESEGDQCVFVPLVGADGWES